MCMTAGGALPGNMTGVSKSAARASGANGVDRVGRGAVGGGGFDCVVAIVRGAVKPMPTVKLLAGRAPAQARVATTTAAGSAPQ